MIPWTSLYSPSPSPTLPQRSDRDPLPDSLATEIWYHVELCLTHSLDELPPPPPKRNLMVATEARIVCKWTLRILLEYFLVFLFNFPAYCVTYIYLSALLPDKNYLVLFYQQTKPIMKFLNTVKALSKTTTLFLSF